MAGKKVVGCKNSGDRISDWLHVNSAGKVFLCCNDYNFEYQFGDLNNQTVNEIWRSEKHIEVVERAFKEICTKCLSASLETDVTKGSTVVGEMRFAR
jgi:radical SAM protein with 4Fe4S-binding SPASM domain